MTGFIWRWTVHAEWHPDHRPRFSIRRAPRHGQRVTDGGEEGALIACRECSGDGYLFIPRNPPGRIGSIPRRRQGGPR